jgi:hypothetical protein
MRIKPSTKINAMLRIHPQLEEVLEDHDLDIDEVGTLSLRQACAEFELDVDEVLEDIEASLRDSATEGWLDVEDPDTADEDSDSEDDDYEEEEEEEDYYEDDGGILEDDDDEGDEDEDADVDADEDEEVDVDDDEGEEDGGEDWDD